MKKKTYDELSQELCDKIYAFKNDLDEACNSIADLNKRTYPQHACKNLTCPFRGECEKSGVCRTPEKWKEYLLYGGN